jgi:tetratricopeptide (TPR) repeat protein
MTKPASPQNRSHRRILLAAAAAVVLALGGGLWLWLAGREVPPAPPDPDLSEVDPEAARLIAGARRRVEAEPRSASAWGRLGQALRAHDLGAEANDCFLRAERLAPREPRWPYLRGLTLVLTSPAEGIACLERAVSLCGAQPAAPRLRLAEVLLEQGRLEEAEAHFGRALSQSPDARARLGLARLALARDDWDGALEHLAACQDDPHARKLAHTLRAEALFRRGQSDTAREEARQAEESPEGEPWPDPFVAEVERLQVGLRVRLARADALARQGREEEAITLLEETARLRPDEADVWLLLGQVHLRRKALEPAGLALAEAVRLRPNSVEGWFGLGCVESLRGRPERAADCFRRAKKKGDADHFR